MGTTSQHIRNGQDAKDSEGYAPVVRLWLWDHTKNDFFGCSGTVIAPHLVMTAAHCFESCTAAAPGNGCRQTSPEVLHEFGFGQDGDILDFYYGAGNVVVKSNATTGIDLSGDEHLVDWVWFPKEPFPCNSDCSNFNPAALDNPPDIAVVHVTKPFSQDIMPIMPSSTLPSPNNLTDGQAVDIVGYSKYGGDDAGVFVRRRKATVNIVKNPPPVKTKYRKFTVQGNLVCNGDSGGAALIYNNIESRWELAGVISGGGNTCQNNVTGYSFIAYITYDFLDQLCPFGPWSVCAGQTDRDQDGVLDSQDNCPGIPNADQMNCNREDEVLGGRPEKGDACDKMSCTHASLAETAGEVTKNAQIKPSPPFPNPQVPTPAVGYRTQWETAHIDYRSLGYHATLKDGQEFEVNYTVTDHLKTEYCACHDFDDPAHTADNPVFYSDSDCKTYICPDGGRDNSQAALAEHTGWLGAWWRSVGESQKCSAKDKDSNLWPSSTPFPNDCDDEVQNQSFSRLYGSTTTRPAFCTARAQEPGCQQGDFVKSGKVQGGLRSLEWFWLKQDLPHSSSAPYDWKKTHKARVRLRTHPHNLGPAYGNHSSGLQTMELKTVSSYGKPFIHPSVDLLYKVPPYWVNPLTMTPPPLPEELLHLVVIHRDLAEELAAADFNWAFDWQNSTSAGRGLVGAVIGEEGGTHGPADMAQLGGDGSPQNAVTTRAFGAAQLEGGTFVFGGMDAAGSRYDGFWFGDGMTFELISGSTPMSGGSSAASSSSPTSSSKASTSLLATWKAKNPPKKKYTPVKDLISTSLKAFSDRLKKLAKGKGALSTSSFSAPLFVGGTPPSAQSSSLVALTPDFSTVTVLYGDTGTSPAVGSAVLIGIFDLQAGIWISGTVDWDPGPGARRHAGYTIRGEDLVFYGGESGGAARDGLYITILEPGALMSGEVPVQLDGASQISPGARRHAALAFDPLGDGQAGPHGGGYIYLFGGIDNAGTLKNDLWRFALSSQEWTLLSDGSGPDSPPAMVPAGMAVTYTPEGAATPVVYTGYTGAVEPVHWAYSHNPADGWAVVQDQRKATVPEHHSSFTSPAVTGCFAQDAQGQLVATACDRSEAQTFQLRPVSGLDELRYEVVRRSDGACLRLDGPLLSRTVGTRQCGYVAWLTPFSLGSCGDDRARFDVEAWDEGFRLRLRFPCTEGGAPAGFDDGSCVDSDATGADVLRVFWCHDGDRERQKLQAPGWPSFSPNGGSSPDGGVSPDGGLPPDAGAAP